MTAQPTPREVGTPRRTPLQTQEQQQRDAAAEALQRQARDRMERDRQQIEDNLQRQQDRDGGMER